MLISVVLCTYNGEDFIEEQLKSIINQSLKVNEIIICDDCSTDNTLELIYQIKDTTNINIVIEKNGKQLGVTKNFEKAISQTTGDIIFFSDQDDIWEYNKVEKILKVFDDNERINLVFTNATLFDNNGIIKDTAFDRFGFNRKAFDQDQFACCLKKWYVTGATMAARKDFVDKLCPFPSFWLHDMWLSFNASMDNSIYCMQDCLTKYRQHDNQVVGAKELRLKEQLAIVVDYGKEAQFLEEVMNLSNASGKQKDMIIDKIAYLNKRAKLIEKNKFVRLFAGLGMFKYYKKYTGHILKSYAKDVVR